MKSSAFSDLNLKPIREEFDLGERKRKFRGKTIKIKKLVKKETGSFTLKDTLLHGDDSSMDVSTDNTRMLPQKIIDPNVEQELSHQLRNIIQGNDEENILQNDISQDSTFLKQQMMKKKPDAVVKKVDRSEQLSKTPEERKKKDSVGNGEFSTNRHSPGAYSSITGVSDNNREIRDSRFSVVSTTSYIVKDIKFDDNQSLVQSRVSYSHTKQDNTNFGRSPRMSENQATEPQSRRVNRRVNPMFLSSQVHRPAFRGVSVTREPAVVIDGRQRGSSTVSMRASRFSVASAVGGDMGTSRYIPSMLTKRVETNNRTEVRKNNHMYHSQAVMRQSNLNLKSFKKDMQLFKLPPKVKKFIDGAEKEVKYLEEAVDKQKDKMSAEIDHIINEVTSRLMRKKEELVNSYDNYVIAYKNNLDSLRDKAASLKDTSGWLRLQNSQNGERLVRLTDISYYKRSGEMGNAKVELYKKKEHKNICELRNLKKEVSKHSLEFYVSELERMGIHVPMFAHTSSSNEYLRELKMNLFKNVDTATEDFTKLNFNEPYIEFKNIIAEPQIFTSLGESRINCLTNMKTLSKFSNIKSEIYDTSHKGNITCILNVDDISIASGSLDGEVHIMQHKTGKETHNFKLQDSSPVTALGRIRTSRSEFQGTFDNKAQEPQTPNDVDVFLISGHGSPSFLLTVWDIKLNKMVKQFASHTDDVTCISTLQDGHTIISGSKNGNIAVNDISSKKVIKTLGHITKSAIMCIYQMNDLSNIVVGYQNGEIMLASIVYGNNIASGRAVCLDLLTKKRLKVGSGVLCLNESHINPDTLISGHEDHKIRIWNLQKEEVSREIATNKTPVLAMLTIENPFNPDLENNFHLISFGDNKDDVYFNQPEKGNAFQLRFSTSLSLNQSRYSNPSIQLYRKSRTSAEKGINFVTFVNEAKRSILSISID